MQDILVALSDNCETMNLVDGLVDRTVVTKDARELGKVFNVKEDGLYYIGFNTETEAHRGFLSINKIEVRRIGSISGPAAPSGLRPFPERRERCPQTSALPFPRRMAMARTCRQ